MKNKELTRKELEELGVIELIRDNDRWGVVRLWWDCGSRGKGRTEDKKVKKVIWEKKTVCKHKYSSDKTYPIIVFSKGPRDGNLSVTVSRLVYAWFNDIVPEGYAVDHIDNNPFNNSLDNLQLLTDQENLEKRYSDNNKRYFNQYHNTKKE